MFKKKHDEFRPKWSYLGNIKIDMTKVKLRLDEKTSRL